VRDLQRRLTAAGCPPAGAAQGSFDAATVAAVCAFQRHRGLHERGECDEATWSALVEASWSLGDRLLFLTSPNLRGDDVASLQACLARLGFDSGKVDGIFGPLTADALRELQANLGVTVDGTCGPATVRLIATISSQSGTGPGVSVLRDMLHGSPGSLAATRVVLGHFGGLSPLTRALARELRRQAATVMTLDEPDVHVQAKATNQFDGHLYLGFESRPEPATVICFYRAPSFESTAGRCLAERIGERLATLAGRGQVEVAGMRLPILRETKMPAVLCVLGPARRAADAATVIGLAILDALDAWATA
jgi:N-acetylmuramoyl-L-alanine amidase